MGERAGASGRLGASADPDANPPETRLGLGEMTDSVGAFDGFSYGLLPFGCVRQEIGPLDPVAAFSLREGRLDVLDVPALGRMPLGVFRIAAVTHEVLLEASAWPPNKNSQRPG